MSAVSLPIVTLETGAQPVTTTGIVRSWNVGTGPQPGICQVELPVVTPGSFPVTFGSWVNVFLDSALVFRGTVLSLDEGLSGSASTVLVTIADVRREMSGRQIGQYGIGPVATFGGWPSVGFDLVFNEHNRPNRSAELDPGSDWYNIFDTTAAAVYWEYGDMLKFIFKWYVLPAVCGPGLEVFPDNILSAPLIAEALEVRLSAGNVCDAITRIMALAGGTWTVEHQGTIGGNDGVSRFVPLADSIDPHNTRTLGLNSPAASAVHTPGPYTVKDVQIKRDCTNVWGRFEVQSAPKHIETSYLSEGTNALLTRVTTGKEIPDDMVCYFGVDVTKYLLNNLESALPAGSLPKKWASSLVTRRNVDGYVAAGVALNVDDDPIPCHEMIWLALPGGSYRRVKSGVHVDLKKMRLYIRRKGQFFGATKEAAADPWDFPAAVAATLRCLFTVATEVEYPETQQAFADTDFGVTPRTLKVMRDELKPGYRIASKLPDLASTDPSVIVTYAGTLELYDTWTDKLMALATQLRDQSGQMDVQMTVTLPFCPAITPGDAIVFAPFDILQLTVNPRVLSVRCNAATMDTVITAARNIHGRAQ